MTTSVLPKPVVKIFGEIVAELSTAFSAYIQGLAVVPKMLQGVKGVAYQYGHLPDLNNAITSKVNSPSIDVKFTQYPVIWLVQDFPETRGGGKTWEEVTLRVIILTKTEQQWDAEQRYAETFEPILIPLYENLLQTLAVGQSAMKYLEYQHVSMIQHTATHRLMWGRTSGEGNTANKAVDYIDAIELTGLKLKIKYQKCF